MTRDSGTKQGTKRGRPAAKPNLSNPEDRSTVLSVLRKGGTIKAAAKAIGTYAKAVHRYARDNPAFARAVAGAVAVGGRANAVDGAAVDGVSEVEFSDPVPNLGGPRTPSVVAADVLGLDVGLVGSADDAMPSVPGLPPITVGNFIALMWKRAHGLGDSPGQACSTPVELAGIAVCRDVLTAPTIAAQRRLDDVARRIAQAETVGDVGGGIGVDLDSLDGAGMVFLELPANGSEAPGHEPRPLDEVDA